jgi:Arc/MetJ-type ribon-helix-helix transcriptional regulator
MNEKTTVYLEPDLKEKVQIRLIQEGKKRSMSALINELLAKWFSEQDKWY